MHGSTGGGWKRSTQGPPRQPPTLQFPWIMQFPWIIADGCGCGRVELDRSIRAVPVDNS
jgi:hypothetical protein